MARTSNDIARRDAAKVMQKARSGLIMYAPFFGSLALRLKLEPDENCKTAMTNGKVIRYNPAYVNGLTQDEARGLLAHEVMHCSQKHHLRMAGRSPNRWNAAADYVINPMLQDCGLVLPKTDMINPAFAGMMAEKVYDLLPDDEDQGGDQGNQGGDQGQGDQGQGQGAPGDQGNDEDPGGCGGVEPATNEDGSAPSEPETKVMEAEWNVATIQAAQAAKQRGTLPGSITDLIKELTNPRVDWRTVLRHFVEATARNDYAWSRPSRRFAAMGLCLPSLYSQEVGHIVIGTDTSGSTREYLARFGGEMRAIIEELQPARVTVIYCDAEVQCVEEYDATQGKPFVMRADGQGGTAVQPVFDWIAEQAEQPACLIYLTDLEVGDFPEHAPYPVLWAACGTDDRAPIGETIRVD